MPATDKLIAGYQRFREGYYEAHKDQLVKLAKEGQAPKIALISCSDSRVEPSVILDCEPGDLFVIRNVANLVPPCESNDSLHGTSAALEFAVTDLEVESIIVLGHTQCGGIKALMDTPASHSSSTFIGKWMHQLESVRHEILCDDNIDNQEDRYNCCERKGIKHSLDNLMTFPWVKERVENGTLKLHGWRYDLSRSLLCEMDTETGEFNRIT
ncbi:carbonic anhydrase [Psychromonas sp. psych-6C06]|uniref:carbonic anhydrase n=1 Tax=Psychromonas sp. psych-6C06 TaxID=2058089 RepID=UPI000C33D56B|nr:carbonic anhydrase [Psychromonas sp. psych-6C06]PKF63338.1 carbonic anhydrase [Psychromonas sp. psych-6C06]